MAQYTDKMSFWNGSSFIALNSVAYWSGSAWLDAKLIWRFDGTNWIIRYSTPTVTCPDVNGSNQGNASSGLVTSPAAAPVVGGNFSASLSYFWQFVSGDSGIVISSNTASAPTWSKVESTSSTAVWRLNVIDNFSGAIASVEINVTLTWTNSALLLHVTGANASGSYEVTNGPITNQTVTTGIGGASGGCVPGGGNGDYTFAWTYVSGDAAITCSNAAIQNPTWSKSMSASGGATTTATTVWQISLNDTNGDGPVTTTITITLTAKSDNAYPTLAVSPINASGEIDIGTYEGTYCTTVPTTTGGCTPSGGNGTYTFSWSYVSGSTAIQPNSKTVQNPVWSAFMCVSAGNAPNVLNAVWQISLTDSAGNGPVTAQVNVQLILTADHIYPALSVTGQDANGKSSVGFASGTVCQNVSNTGGGCTPNGGSGIYNYAWSYVSGDNTIAINNANVQNPVWTANICANSGDGGAGVTKTAVWKVSVTDSAGFGPVTANITVTLNFAVLNGP